MARGKSAGAVRIDFIAGHAEFAKGVQKNMTSMDRFKRKSLQVAKKIRQNWRIITAAVAGFVVGVVAALKKMADYSSTLVEASRSTGLAVKELERMRTLFKGDGVGIQRTDKAMQEFNVRIGFAQRGVGQYTRAFEKLGINLKRENGTFKSQSELLTEVAGKLQKTGSQSEAASLAYELFGRAGKDLLPILQKHGLALDENAKKANRFRTVSDKQHELNKDMGQEFTNLTDNVVDLIQRGLSPMAPAVTGAIQSINRLISSMKAGFESLGRVVAQILGWVGDLFGEQWRSDSEQLAKNLDRIARLDETIKTGNYPEIAGYKDVAGTHAERARLIEENKAIKDRMEKRRKDMEPELSIIEESESGTSIQSTALKRTGRDLEEGVKAHRQKLIQERGVARRLAEEAQKRGERSYIDDLWQRVYAFNDSAQADPGQFSPMRHIKSSPIGRATMPYRGRHYDTAALLKLMRDYDPATFIRDRRNARADANIAAYNQDAFTKMIEAALHGPIDLSVAPTIDAIDDRRARRTRGEFHIPFGVIPARNPKDLLSDEDARWVKKTAAERLKMVGDPIDDFRAKRTRGEFHVPFGVVPTRNPIDLLSDEDAKWVKKTIAERLKMTGDPIDDRRARRTRGEFHVPFGDIPATNPIDLMTAGDREWIERTTMLMKGFGEGDFVKGLEKSTKLVQTFEGALSGWSDNLLQGFTNTRDAIEDLLGSIAQAMWKHLVTDKFARVGSDILTSITGSIFGGLFGGGSIATANPHTRANGGHARGMTLVGERGPELVDFSQPGMVYSNEQLRAAFGGGGGGVTIVNNINSTDGPGVTRALSRAMPGFVAAAQSATLDLAKRPGPGRNVIRGIA